MSLRLDITELCMHENRNFAALPVEILMVLCASQFLELYDTVPCVLAPLYVATVQLSSKVTFTRIPNTSCMHFRCVPAASGKKGRGTHVRLAATLSQGFALTWTCLVHVLDASHVHPRHVLHVFQMRADIALELSCTVSVTLYYLCTYFLWIIIPVYFCYILLGLAVQLAAPFFSVVSY